MLKDLSKYQKTSIKMIVDSIVDLLVKFPSDNKNEANVIKEALYLYQYKDIWELLEWHGRALELISKCVN